jgi:hypothetical protein
VGSDPGEVALEAVPEMAAWALAALVAEKVRRVRNVTFCS